MQEEARRLQEEAQRVQMEFMQEQKKQRQMQRELQSIGKLSSRLSVACSAKWMEMCRWFSLY